MRSVIFEAIELSRKRHFGVCVCELGFRLGRGVVLRVANNAPAVGVIWVFHR